MEGERRDGKNHVLASITDCNTSVELCSQKGAELKVTGGRIQNICALVQSFVHSSIHSCINSKNFMTTTITGCRCVRRDVIMVYFCVFVSFARFLRWSVDVLKLVASDKAGIQMKLNRSHGPAYGTGVVFGSKDSKGTCDSMYVLGTVRYTRTTDRFRKYKLDH